MTKRKEKFSAQADPVLLKAIRKMAKVEGRQLNSIIDEALADLVKKRNRTKPRPEIMAHYQASFNRFDLLYKHLAK
jgi:hypothetical protein